MQDACCGIRTSCSSPFARPSGAGAAGPSDVQPRPLWSLVALGSHIPQRGRREPRASRVLSLQKAAEACLARGAMLRAITILGPPRTNHGEPWRTDAIRIRTKCPGERCQISLGYAGRAWSFGGARHSSSGSSVAASHLVGRGRAVACRVRMAHAGTSLVPRCD